MMEQENATFVFISLSTDLFSVFSSLKKGIITDNVFIIDTFNYIKKFLVFVLYFNMVWKRYYIFSMLFFTFRISILFLLNLLVIESSTNLNSQQLLVDLRPIIDLSEADIFVTYVLISLFVSLITVFLLKIFAPFIEIYLLYYLRFSFYILVNLLSLSSVYLVLRVYGYSRFYVLIYLGVSSIFLLLSDRFKK